MVTLFYSKWFSFYCFIVPPADTASHVSLCASKWWWAWAADGRLHLHVSGGADQCQWGLGVRHLSGHRAVWPAAGELRQPRRRVWHLGCPRVRNRSTIINPNLHLSIHWGLGLDWVRWMKLKYTDSTHSLRSHFYTNGQYNRTLFC